MKHATADAALRAAAAKLNAMLAESPMRQSTYDELVEVFTLVMDAKVLAEHESEAAHDTAA